MPLPPSSLVDAPAAMPYDLLSALDKAWAPLLPGQTIHDRLGNADGILMQLNIDSVYEDSSMRGKTVAYFDDAVSPTLSRHAVNDRVQESVIEGYVTTLMNEGLGPSRALSLHELSNYRWCGVPLEWAGFGRTLANLYDTGDK